MSPRSTLHRGMVVVRDARQRRQRLALRAGADDQLLADRNVVEVGRLDEHLLRHVDVTEIARHVHVAAHRAADDDHLAAGVDTDVDRLLHPVDVRREARDEDAPAAHRDDLAERLADDALRAREARRAPRSSSRRAAGRRRGCRASASRPTSVRSPSTGVWSSFQSPLWKTSPALVSIAMPTASGIECAMRMNSSLNGPIWIGSFLRLGLAQLGRAQQPVLVELRLHEPERQARRPDLLDANLAHQERQRADVILVRMRQHDRADVLVAQVAEVREDHVDAEMLVARERHPGVDDDHLVAELVDGHVLPDLTEPAERDHTQYVGHRGGSLGGDEQAQPLEARRAPPRSRPRSAPGAAVDGRPPRGRAGSARL